MAHRGEQEREGGRERKGEKHKERKGVEAGRKMYLALTARYCGSYSNEGVLSFL